MDVSDNVTNLCDIEINSEYSLHCGDIFTVTIKTLCVWGGRGEGGGGGFTLIHINFQQLYLRIGITIYDIDINITIYSCYYYRPVMITS